MPVKAKWSMSDFSLVLEDDDYRNSHLEKLELFFQNFRSNVAAQIEKRLIYEKGMVIVCVFLQNYQRLKMLTLYSIILINIFINLISCS